MVAKLQGFPDDWQISGRKTAAYRQVGNAFPPPVAEAVGRSIREALTGHRAVQLSLLNRWADGKIRHRKKQSPRLSRHWYSSGRRSTGESSLAALEGHYRLLVTEVLLRQTRAAAVAGYVGRFFQLFPDPLALAAVPEDELAAELRALGFSRQRAGQLHALAKRLSTGT